MDKLLTILEAAEYLKVDLETFQNLIEKYRIPHYKIGGRFIRFSQQELEKYKKDIQNFKEKKEIKPLKQEKYNYQNSSIKDKILDFIRFYDFYIITAVIIFLLLYYIFKY